MNGQGEQDWLCFRETLIDSILGTNQLAIREARLSDSSIFNGLQPSKMAARSCAAGSAEEISASFVFRNE
jgi:hypothetical protein